MWLRSGAVSILLTLPSLLPAQDAPPLRLTEFRSVALPGGFAAAGVAAGPDGSALVYSTDHDRVLLIPGDGGGPIAVEIDRPVAGGWSGDGFEILSAGGRSVLSIGSDGTVAASRPLRVEGTILTGVRSSTGWILATEAASGAAFLLRAPEDGPPDTLLRLGELDARPAVLAEVRDGLLVLFAASPFDAWLLPATGAPRWLFSARPPEDDDPEGAALWAPLPVLPVGGGMLTTVADLRSDRRVVSRWDAEGRLLRRTVVDAPIGLAAISPDGATVVAIRRARTQEVVWYARAAEDSSPSPMPTPGGAR